jgi:hypothetical protein
MRNPERAEEAQEGAGVRLIAPEQSVNHCRGVGGGKRGAELSRKLWRLGRGQFGICERTSLQYDHDKFPQGSGIEQAIVCPAPRLTYGVHQAQLPKER